METERSCEYFPKDMLEEIMSWLPPESLKCFKCVCKSWYALINSLMNNRAFVAKHLANMKTKRVSSPFIHYKVLAVLDHKGQKTRAKGTYLLTLVGAFPSDGDAEYFPRVNHNIEFLSNNGDSSLRLVSYCNGVICLFAFYREDNIFLLNPAIREFKIVSNAGRGKGYRFATRAVGFGFDSRSNDFKVVTIKSHDEYRYKGPYQAEVYTLSTNSWRDIELNVKISYIPSGFYQAVYYNGVCYWYLWNRTRTLVCIDVADEVFQIVSFDVADEVFRIIPLPESVATVGREWKLLEEKTKIAVWKESLVLFFYTELYPIVIDMWVMDACSNGIQGACSWTKHLTIGPLVGIQYPLEFWDDDKLFMQTQDRKMVFYDLRSQELHYDEICWISVKSNRCITYVESLVSVLQR